MNQRNAIRKSVLDDPAEREAQLAKLGRFVEGLMAAGFYGKVTIGFQSGNVVDVRTEQVTKLDEL